MNPVAGAAGTGFMSLGQALETLLQPLAPVRQLGGAALAAQNRVRRPRRARAELGRRDAPDARVEARLLEDRLRELRPRAVAARGDVVRAVREVQQGLRCRGETPDVR